jgi:endonuclease/exonuclease/phosphatase family metal-dependent hydrolase
METNTLQPPRRNLALLRAAGNFTLSLVIDLYTLVLVPLLLARLLTGERWGVVAVMNNLMPAVLFPAVLFLLLAILLRRVRHIGQMLILVAVLILSYGGTFIPNQPAPATESELSLRVVSYNALSIWTPDANTRRADVLAASDADIIALQEANEGLAAYLQTHLGDIYPHQDIHSHGIGVISKYPIVADNVWRVDGRATYQRVTVNIQGNRVLVYNVHAPAPIVIPGPLIQFNDAPRKAGVDDLLARLATETDPTIIAGDFNMTEWTDDYQRIIARYTDTHREAGFGFGATYPGRGAMIASAGWTRFIPPLLRVDYVFHNGVQLRTLSAGAISASGGSDHHPYRAIIALDTR